MAPHIIAIPSNDSTFREFLSRAFQKGHPGSAGEFERHLRRTYPRAVVRERGLAGEAPVVLQPTTGDAIAVDLRVSAGDYRIAGVFRLAPDVDAPAGAPRTSLPDHVEYRPATDVAFRAYADRSLARMPEPTPEGLALRLRRLYPHAHVQAGPDGWIARRDRDADHPSVDEWWRAPNLARVRYDAQALILDANAEATTFFGRPLAGHHWQEFVTAGSTEEVAIMLDILAAAGAA